MQVNQVVSIYRVSFSKPWTENRPCLSRAQDLIGHKNKHILVLFFH